MRNANLLGSETSPYLLQHAENPVHWRPWGPEALAEAQASNKPILLSVGYAACHWCHVMAHESFEDPKVAAVMNELYVNIKVDREERPDVDQLYMSALHLLGQQGGWPLTMFLTPRGEPVWGGTYFPKESKWGRPGFIDVLREIARLFHEEPGRIEQNRSAIIERLATPARSTNDGAELSPALISSAAERLLGAFDPVNGGLAGAPKFPQPSLLLLLWQAGMRSGDTRCLDAVKHALTRMSLGGIYDHLGGGFARYSVDEQWLVPHFEKMLYDNAQLIELLTNAYLESGSHLFRSRIEETVAWLEREMIAEGGAFASSLDADSEGEEGRFYVWTPAEIEAALGEDAAFFRAAYDVTEAGNFEGRNVLNRLKATAMSEPDERRLAALRERLLTARAQRVRPARDDKILADWNGLAIAALARAGAALDRPDWIERARTAHDFIIAHMMQDGRIAHSYRAGRLGPQGMASDYAAMARAAIALAETTGDPAPLEAAAQLLDTLDQHHWSDGQGYLLAANDAADLIYRMPAAHDDATPNHNALAAEACDRLYLLTGERGHRERAERIFTHLAAGIAGNPFAHAGLLAAFDLHLTPISVVTIGERHNVLARAGQRIPDANRVLLMLEPEEVVPAGHPAAGKTAVDGKPTAYVCIGETCSLPVTDPAALEKEAKRDPQTLKR